MSFGGGFGVTPVIQRRVRNDSLVAAIPGGLKAKQSFERIRYPRGSHKASRCSSRSGRHSMSPYRRLDICGTRHKIQNFGNYLARPPANVGSLPVKINVK